MMSSPKIDVLLQACCSSVGEGPHWDVDSQCLYFVDLMEGGVHKWDYVSGTDTKLYLDGTVSFVIPRDKGGLVVGLNKTVSVLDMETGKTQCLAEVEQGRPNNRFNDAKCDRAGRLWAGTMGRRVSPTAFEDGVGSLYRLGTDLTVSKQQEGLTISNGMDWTSDNRVMYFIDSTSGQIYAYDFDSTRGSISNRRVVVDLANKFPAIQGLPDGMCLDTDDKIWVAVFGSSSVYRFDPMTGTLMTSLKFPTTDMTSCCFGGPQLDELLVTCGRADNQPQSGSLFRVTGLGVKGRPPTNFMG